MSFRDYVAVQILPVIYAEAKPGTKYSVIVNRAYKIADEMVLCHRKVK